MNEPTGTSRARRELRQNAIYNDLPVRCNFFNAMEGWDLIMPNTRERLLLGIAQAVIVAAVAILVIAMLNDFADHVSDLLLTIRI